MRKILCLAFFLCLGSAFWAFAHTAADAPHQTYLVGDLTLENGKVIKDFTLSYVVRGTLNQDKSNAILMTASFMGNHHRIDFLIGPGKAFDTDKYCIICVDAIGNGLTTSPSTSKTQKGMDFPEFSLRDMVESQYILLTKALGIRHLVAVTGASMGGMQSIQWGVSHPKFMDYLIALTPEGRCPAWTAAIMDIVIKTIKMDPDWKNGTYTANPASSVRLRTDIVLLLTASTSLAMKENYLDNPTDFLKYMKQYEDTQLAFDANDSIYQAQAIINHNVGNTPGFNGDYYKALESIEAKTLMMTAPIDVLTPPEECVEMAKHIKGSRYVQIPSVQGHFAATAKKPEDVTFMNNQIIEFMKKK